MDANMISPFLQALFEVLPAIGLTRVEKGRIHVKDNLVGTMDVTTLVGLSDDIRGNVTYGMSQETARQTASAMMMGMPVEVLDAMARSAIAELANMVTANASTLFSRQGHRVNISPPTMITGENVMVMVSQVQTITIEVNTDAGTIELNVGLEM
jgi:chemotaxis protein CheX